MKVKKVPLMLFGVNCYIVYDEEAGEAAIIDPGIVNPREITVIDAFLRKNHLKPVAIINTHLHIDHAVGNAALAAKYGVPVIAHRDDSFLGESMDQQAREFGIVMKALNAGVTQELLGGEKIKIGNGELEVIHVPGHSPGGIALYDAKDGFLISGDTLFAGSIGRSDLPGGDIARLFESIKKKLYELPANTIVYPGHGPATTIGAERTGNPFVRG